MAAWGRGGDYADAAISEPTNGINDWTATDGRTDGRGARPIDGYATSGAPPPGLIEWSLVAMVSQ